MNILHISISDTKGGASKAAFRISESLNYIGINSKLLVENKFGSSSRVNSVKQNKFIKLIKKKINNLYMESEKFDKNYFLSLDKFGIDITKNNLVKNASIIHLHWINNCFLSLKIFKKITKLNKPVVWTLHDIWPFTGGCHIGLGCKNYKYQCGFCPAITKRSKKKDITYKTAVIKSKIYNKLKLSIAACSNWMRNCAKESSIFNNQNIRVIPNPIDINLYKPMNSQYSRELLNIDTNKFVILFGAMSALRDKNKGYDLLEKNLGYLSRIRPELINKMTLLIFGASDDQSKNNLPIKSVYLGELNDDYSLVLSYNSADIFIAPSREENLPNTVMESLSCGTPVVAYNIGGMKDMLNHKKNGYLAEEKSETDLANGILWFYENRENMNTFNKNSRNKVIHNFNYKTIGEEYLKLYEDLLNEK